MTKLAWRRSGELIRSHWAIFALLVLWSFAPLAEALVHVARHGGIITGAYGYDPVDQLSYLAWIRDGGSHLLGSNLWRIAPTTHDYLEPMFFISGLLWRLGVSVQLAYLIWKPVALVVLFLGFAVYVRHLLDGSRRAQAAALVIALFYETPVLAVAHWTSLLSFAHQFQLLFASDDADSALNLWGFDHAAVTIGLMPVFLIAAERLLEAWGDERTPTRGWIALAAASGTLVSWFRPWQGLTLLVIVGALFVLQPPRRRFVALVIPAAATVLPLIYSAVLTRTDPSWVAVDAFSRGTHTAPWWALLASFGPLTALALLGIRAPRSDREWMLLLWVPACAAVYFLVPQFPPHALCGVTLPLAVLAVRGFSRLRLPRPLAVPTAVASIAAVTLPAAVYHAKNNRDDFTDPTHADALETEVLPDSRADALRFIATSPRPGGVLAPPALSMSVPPLTGRPVFDGDPEWRLPTSDRLDTTFYAATLHDPTGVIRRRILRGSGATFVVAECGPPGLARAIAPLALPVRRFGCVTVYETRPVGARDRSAT
jgi:hypothetical protein